MAANGVDWHDIREWGVEGKGWQDTARFPARARGVVRDVLWELSRFTTGMCVRFVAAAPGLWARWTLLAPDRAMSQTPATAVGGLDLYGQLPDGRWCWVATGAPGPGAATEILSDVDAGQRPYALYLPLYNGVERLEIGVPKGGLVVAAL